MDPTTGVELIVPAGISDDRAIERARRERAGELRRIRFFLDWSHGYPLWESGTGKYAMEPDDFGLSAELADLLAEWSRFWEHHSDPFDGWDTKANLRWWLRTGDDLVERLTIEVYDTAIVLPQFRKQS